MLLHEKNCESVLRPKTANTATFPPFFLRTPTSIPNPAGKSPEIEGLDPLPLSLGTLHIYFWPGRAPRESTGTGPLAGSSFKRRFFEIFRNFLVPCFFCFSHPSDIFLYADPAFSLRGIRFVVAKGASRSECLPGEASVANTDPQLHGRCHHLKCGCIPVHCCLPPGFAAAGRWGAGTADFAQGSICVPTQASDGVRARHVPFLFSSCLHPNHLRKKTLVWGHHMTAPANQQ